MNILIAMPKSNIDKYIGFSFGIAYVAASLKSKIHSDSSQVHTLNMAFISGKEEDYLEGFIAKNNIAIFAIGGLSKEYNEIYRVIQIIKHIKPSMIILVGGGLISADPLTAMLALEVADVGMIGEGEETCCELVDALNKKRNLKNIKGIIFREGNQYIRSDPRPDIDNLDDLPFPDYEGFQYSKYLELNNISTLDIIASRSCPFSCTFCFHPSGVKYRKRTLDNIFSEIDHLIKIIDNNDVIIALQDELFADDEKRVVEFCERISQYHLKWSCQLRVSNVSRNLLELMKKSGCYFVSYGVESADNNILKSMRKHITIEQVNEAILHTYKQNMQIRANLIFGDINESVESVSNTWQWHEKNRKYGITLSPINIFPGTPLYDYACEKDIIKDKIQFLRDGCPLVNVSKLSEKEYWDLNSKIFEDIIHMNRAKTVRLNSFDEDGNCQVTYTCAKCNQESDAKISLLTPTMQYFCPHCYKHQIIDFRMIVLKENFIVTDLPKQDNVAIWGASLALVNFIYDLHLSDISDGMFIVDINKEKQMMTLAGHQIYSPKIITKKEIKNFIIGTKSREKEICNSIKNTFPKVEKIYTFKLRQSLERLPYITCELYEDYNNA